MEMLPATYAEFKAFYGILVRVAALLFMFPFFSAKIIPTLCKAGLSALVALLLFPLVAHTGGRLLASPVGMARVVVGELFMGMVLGLMVLIFFEGIKMMGWMVGFQTGFSITNILDPQNQVQISIMSNIAYLVALMIFLGIDGHHILLQALKESFDVAPVGAAGMNEGILQTVIDTAGEIFIIAVKIGSPAIVALLFTKAAFGLITKLVPQINIMIVAFPVQIVVGLVFFGISLRLLVFFIQQYAGGLGRMLIYTIKLMM